MENDRLWHTFAQTGRVEDYLRYRGIDLPDAATNSVQEEGAVDGHRPKTASDDRRTGPA